MKLCTLNRLAWFVLAVLFFVAGWATSAGKTGSWQPIAAARLEAMRLGDPAPNNRCCRAPYAKGCFLPCSGGSPGLINCIPQSTVTGHCNLDGSGSDINAACEDKNLTYCATPARQVTTQVDKCTLSGMTEACSDPPNTNRCAISQTISPPNAGCGSITITGCNLGDALCPYSGNLCN